MRDGLIAGVHRLVALARRTNVAGLQDSDVSAAAAQFQRERFDAVLLESLRPFLLGSAVMIVGAALYLALTLNSALGLMGLVLGLAISTGFAKVYKSLAAGRIPTHYAHPLAASISAAGYLLLAFSIIGDKTPHGELRFMALALAVVTGGALYLNWRWLAAVMAFMFSGWILINLAVGFEFHWQYHLTGMVFIALTTFVGYAVRKRSIVKMIDAQQENERQNAQLTDALERAHRSEAELFVERHIADQIVDTMGQGLVLLDDDGAIEYANNAAEDIFGRSMADVSDKPATSIFRGPNGEPHERFLRVATSDHPGEETFETFIEQPDGTRANVLVSTVSRPGGGTIVTLTDLTVRKQIEAKLERLAHYDALTGLANRAHMIEKIEAVSHRPAQHNEQVAVLFLDLDHFKQINDTFGHAVGDQVLIDCAKRIQDCIRNGDTAARFGGDEFVILLVGIESQAAAVEIAERIVESIEQPFILPDSIQHLSGSVGISFATSFEIDAEEMIRQADLAMYEAKHNRFTNAVVYQPEMRARVQMAV